MQAPGLKALKMEEPLPHETDAAHPDPRRHALMTLCARATRAEMRAALDALAPLPLHRDLRRAEPGLAMVRGRMGGTGAPFNLGEATVTRAAVRLEDGTTGFAWLLGHDAERARAAALIDALGQLPDWQARIADVFVEPVRARLAADAKRQREETAATRVNFFTLVRGDVA